MRRRASKKYSARKLLLSDSSATFRDKIWFFLEEPASSRGATIYAAFMVGCICSSLVCGMLLSTEAFHRETVVLRIDLVSDIIFFLEVVARFAFCPSLKSFWFNLYNIIDVLSVVPLIVTLIVYPEGLLTGATDDNFIVLSFILVIRPTLRLLRAARHFYGFRILVHSLMIAMEALPIALFLLVLLVITSGSALYLVEGRDSPEINSIPRACWFALVTVSSVGYGDTVPVTIAGRITCCILMVGGLLYMAIPISIIGSTFSKLWSRRDVILVLDKMRSRMVAWGLDRGNLTDMFANIDTNNSGVIDAAEFKELLEDLHIHLSDERIRNVFDIFDVDGSGSVGAEEFSLVLFPSAKIDKDSNNFVDEKDMPLRKTGSASTSMRVSIAQASLETGKTAFHTELRKDHIRVSQEIHAIVGLVKDASTQIDEAADVVARIRNLLQSETSSSSAELR